MLFKDQAMGGCVFGHFGSQIAPRSAPRPSPYDGFSENVRLSRDKGDPKDRFPEPLKTENDAKIDLASIGRHLCPSKNGTRERFWKNTKNL